MKHEFSLSEICKLDIAYLSNFIQALLVWSLYTRTFGIQYFKYLYFSDSNCSKKSQMSPLLLSDVWERKKSNCLAQTEKY